LKIISGKIFIRIAFVGLSLLCNCSQISAQIDSLLTILNKTSNPTIRADYLLQIAKSTYEQNHDDYLSYSQKALNETTLPQFEDDTLKMKILNNVGCAYSEINDAEKANKHFFDAAALAIKINDQRYLSNLYNNIGLTYGNVQEYDKAIEFHLKSLSIRNLRNDSLGVSISNTNIGAIYYAVKDYHKAKVSFEKSFTISKLINDTEGIAFGYTNLADVLFVEGKHLEALAYYQKYLVMVTEMNYNHSMLYGHKKIGEIHLKLNNLEKAALHLEKAYNMAIASNYTWELTNICLKYAALKKQLGDPDSALVYAQKAMEHFPSSSSKEKLATIHRTFSEIYELDNNNTMALHHLKIHLLEQDSALQKENMGAFAEMEAKYQLTIKEKENYFLKQEQILNAKIISQRTIVALICLVGVFLLGLLVFWLYGIKERKHQLNIELEKKVQERTQHLKNMNQKMERANTELERFFYITSHDLKEPLRTIMSFSTLAKRRLQQNRIDEASEYLGYVKNGTSQMNTLLKGILEFFNIEKKNFHQLESLAVILQNAEEQLALEISKPQLLFPAGIRNEATVFPWPLNLVFKNLIENGIKFNENKVPIIKVNYWDNGTHFYFSVEDNGIGIPEEYAHKIFEMFKRLHSRDKFVGSGIGLSICKKILQQLGGDIVIKKSDDEGTIFEFWINKTFCKQDSTSFTNASPTDQIVSNS